MPYSKPFKFLIMTKLYTATSHFTTFLGDFVNTFVYYFQSALLFIAHLIFHIMVKLNRLFVKFIIPSFYDFLYSTRFFIMVVIQGFCELMALLCITLSSMLINAGRFFNNTSVKLLQKYWW